MMASDTTVILVQFLSSSMNVVSYRSLATHGIDFDLGWDNVAKLSLALGLHVFAYSQVG